MSELTQLQKEAKIRLAAQDLFNKAQRMGITLTEVKFDSSIIKNDDKQARLLNGVTYKDINDD